MLWWAEDATHVDVARYVVMNEDSAVVFGSFPKAAVVQLGKSLVDPDPSHRGSTPLNAYAVDITGLQVETCRSHAPPPTLSRGG